MDQSARMNWKLYAYAALVVLAAYALRISLIPLVGPGRSPFITFFPAVVFCAWRIGVGPAVLAVLPALKNPTISNLSDGDWVAVNTIIEESEAWAVIPRLKEAQAQGIVEYPLNKVVL